MAVTLPWVAAAHVEGQTILDLDATLVSSATMAGPVTLHLEAGTYRVTPVGIAGGGAFDAWSAWSENLNCDVNGENCEQGYESGFELVSASIPWVHVWDGLRYATALQALSHAQSVEFSLRVAQDVHFGLNDCPGCLGGNRGGNSLKVEKVDLARPGTATQSSTQEGGDASRAIDGNTNGDFYAGSVTHTQAELAWWQVDLGGQFLINEIVIWNRTDSNNAQRLSNFRVSVLDASMNEVWEQDFYSQGGYPDPTLTLGGLSTVGQIVKIQLLAANHLSLAEVQVFGFASQGIAVSTPDTVGAHGQSVSIPVRASDLTGLGVVAGEVSLAFDADLLTFSSVNTDGALLSGWALQSNVVEGNGTSMDTLKVAAADSVATAGSGVLFEVVFLVADSVRLPTTSPLTLVDVLFNTGGIPTTTTDGELQLVGHDGSIASAPARFTPGQTLTVTVIDLDADLDGAAGTDSVGVIATNQTNSDTIPLTLQEDAATPGTFTSVAPTEYGAAALSDGVLQVRRGDIVKFSYLDLLDGAGLGPTERTTQDTTDGGMKGALEITRATQPGDTIYVKVTDADLNTDPLASDSAQLVVVSSNGESETVVLTEVSVNDTVFFGRLASTAGASAGTDDDGILNGAKGDTLIATYHDALDSLGAAVDRTAMDQVVDPFGDADGNGQVQAYDASVVLRDVLDSLLTGLDSLQANVYVEPPISQGIDPYDAALILMRRVGLIPVFPVQLASSSNHPQPITLPVLPKRATDTRWLALEAHDGYLSVVADERSGIVAGQLLVSGAQGDVAIAEDLRGFLTASRLTDAGLRIVFAGAEAGVGPGELVRIYGAASASGARLREAAFNDGSITAEIGSSPAALPLVTRLLANAPNPFNPETTIRFELAQAGQVQLEVYDVLGRRVLSLSDGELLSAGTHAAVWRGLDDEGRPVSSGVYFCRLQTSGLTQVQRMLLLR